MYIKINGKSYPCTGYAPRSGTAAYTGVEGLELPVAGAVTLCRDDGFVLCEQDADGYDRQTLEGGVLTLTNEPEPVPMPEPEEPEPPPDPLADIEAMMVDHEYRLTLLEFGGGKCYSTYFPA